MKERFETFTLQIAKISRYIRKIKTEEMRASRLKAPHVSCLHYLYQRGPMTAKELGEVCGEDKAAISRTLIYLEKHGYIYYERNTQKRYKEPILLTETGKEIGAVIENKIEKILQQSDFGVPREELATMYRGLETICVNLERICAGYEFCDNE